tara:strand:- start:107 stop:643 length:537 start_codon:yes stop_codon:yes gene_type:complete
MKHYFILGAVIFGVTGCGVTTDRGVGAGKPPTAASSASVTASANGSSSSSSADSNVPSTVTDAAAPSPTAKTAEALDTTTPKQRAAASRPAKTGATQLGSTVASLGNATEPGLWLKTPLVKTEMQGRVTNPATGKSSTVTLLPIEGAASAGSRMSLAALRLIGASLTELTTVNVSTGG